MYDIDNTRPMPTDLGERTEFNGVVVSIPALLEAASISGNPIEGRRFIDCVLLGPAILAMTETTAFLLTRRRASARFCAPTPRRCRSGPC